MEQQRLTYQETGQFSKLVLDYLEQAPALKSFYHRPPKLESLEAQIQEKSKQFDLQDRTRLVQGLMNQYKSASALSPEIESRINARQSADVYCNDRASIELIHWASVLSI